MLWYDVLKKHQNIIYWYKEYPYPYPNPNPNLNLNQNLNPNPNPNPNYFCILNNLRLLCVIHKKCK